MTINIEAVAANIILVEDDDLDAVAVNRAFQKAKINNPIIRAKDGVEGLEILRGDKKSDLQQVPNILLVDINMPRMGGIEFVKALREDQELKHSVVFMLTTSKSDEDKLAAYDLNVAGYILKSNAGRDFMNLVNLIDAYWRVVELPV